MASAIGNSKISFLTPEGEFDATASSRSLGLSWKPSKSDSVKWVGTVISIHTRNMRVSFDDILSYYMKEVCSLFPPKEDPENHLGMTMGLSCKEKKNDTGYLAQEYWQIICYHGHSMRLHNTQGWFEKWENEGRIRCTLNFAPPKIKFMLGNNKWWETAKGRLVRAVYAQNLSKDAVGCVFFDKPYIDSEGDAGRQTTQGIGFVSKCGRLTKTRLEV